MEDTMDKKISNGDRAVSDLPPRKGQDVKGGMLNLNGTTAAATATAPRRIADVIFSYTNR